MRTNHKVFSKGTITVGVAGTPRAADARDCEEVNIFDIELSGAGALPGFGLADLR